MEIWTTIANEYLERKKINAEKNRVNNVILENPNYTKEVFEGLIKILLQNLLKNDDTSGSESEI